MAARDQDEAAIVDSTAALESLYQAPLAEFVTRRAALVSRFRRSGHKDVATRIAAAAKPSRAAFLVNQVYWRERAAYDAVLETGSAARSAQQARLLGDDSALADSLQARDEAVAAAVERATQIGADDGQPASEAIRAQVRATFEAIAAHGQEGRIAHGQLTTDVELPGLGALGLVLPASAPAPVRRFEVVARRPAAPDDAAEPPAPHPRLVELQTRVADARLREQESGERLAELERALGAATDVLREAEVAAEQAARRLRTAQDAVAAGERARSAAQTGAERMTAEREKAERDLAAWEQREPPPPAPDTPPKAARRTARGTAASPTADPEPRPAGASRPRRRPRR